MVMETLKHLEKLEQERQYLLDCLKVWAVAKASGYSSDIVKAFSFREEFLTKDQKKINRRASIQRRSKPYNGSNYHNCVRLKTGELKPIALVKIPIVKDH